MCALFSCVLFSNVSIIKSEKNLQLYPLIYNCDLKSWKKSWKMERLNFENLGFAKMKKNFDFSFRLLFEMISQLNSIHPYIRISDSTTSSFFLKAITVTWNVTANELRSLSFFWKIPLQTFRIQSCMYRSEKVFDVCIPRLKTKKEEWKVVCNDCIPLCPHSATYFNLKQKLLLTICICASTAKFSIKKYSKWNSI